MSAVTERDLYAAAGYPQEWDRLGEVFKVPPSFEVFSTALMRAPTRVGPRALADFMCERYSPLAWSPGKGGPPLTVKQLRATRDR